ncbi:MAG: HAD-IIA family hydrolase [Anaerolineaceae bacterium]|nr:HAD-IIA family hydrolase [Anaerolineaceae bacterium]
MGDEKILKNIHAMMIDIDGTLFSGSQVLPGMAEFLSFLNDQSIKFLILTNNSTKTPDFYLNKIRSNGGELKIQNILTCASVTADYIKAHYSGRKVYVIGETGILTALEQEGFTILEDFSEQADFVVVGGDHFLTYEKLKFGCLQIRNGAQLIGTNPDVVSPSEEGLIPECGTNIAALEASSGKKAIVIGKPNRMMFDWGLKKIGMAASETAMLGDRLETDILGGNQAGLHTILVETGVDTFESTLEKNIHPDLVVKDLFDLITIWKSQI